MNQMELDPKTGLWVMTKEYLLDRGNCCGSGCLNCPYFEETQPKEKTSAVNCIKEETPPNA